MLQPTVILGLHFGFLTINFSGVNFENHTPNPQTGAYALSCLTWVALPETYVPKSIACVHTHIT
jgi:hypothetical protein